MTTAMIIVETAAIVISPAPTVIPRPTAQNIKTVSNGFFNAVLKRTIDSAPTIPSDNMMFEDTLIMITAVTIDTIGKLIAKLLL